MISIIVAIAKNDAIGKDNQLLWHISEDLKYFKRTTLGHPVIMGRKTWESLPFRPLPKRDNLIITRNKDYKAEGGILIPSIEEALNYAKDKDNVFIMGGGEIYKAFMPYADRLYITRVDKDFEADTFFDKIVEEVWKLESESEVQYDEKEDLHYRYLIYHRRND